MDQLAIGENLFNWANGFLHNRMIQVRVGITLSNEFVLENGTPQGCGISPILLFIAINDLSLKGVSISMFADDTATRNIGRSVNVAKKRVQKAREKVELKFDGKMLKTEKKVKFLGMIFDTRLSWKHHTDYVVDKCNKRINLLKVLADSRWGADKEIMLIVYRGLIRSCMECGSELYDST